MTQWWWYALHLYYAFANYLQSATYTWNIAWLFCCYILSNLVDRTAKHTFKNKFPPNSCINTHKFFPLTANDLEDGDGSMRASAVTCRTSFEIIRSFSKFTSPSTRESLPKCINVRSFLTNGKNGICRQKKKRWSSFKQFSIDSQPSTFEWQLNFMTSIRVHWLLDWCFMAHQHMTSRFGPFWQGDNRLMWLRMGNMSY